MSGFKTGELIGWGIIAVLGIWWLGWLFKRGAAMARKDRAMKTGDPTGLTLEDKEENRAAFIEGLKKSPEKSEFGSLGYLGAVLAVGGIVAQVTMSKAPDFVGFIMIAGVVLLFLALILGGSKNS